MNSDPNLEPENQIDHSKPMSLKLTFLTVAVVSLVAGMAGGVYGALNLSQRPAFQKFFNSGVSNGPNTINQNLVLQEESAITNVVDEATPAVVSIVISKDVNTLFPFLNGQSGTNVQEIGAGSGFFVSADGLVMTNKHVVSDSRAQYTVVTNDGRRLDAKVVAQDPSNDVAIVKVDISNAPHLSFADSSQLELGQHVIAIGNSLGEFQNTVTTGVVSGLSRNIVAGDRTGQEQLEGVIQTDAAINPGNSGGPLLNLLGQVVGINTAVSGEGQSIGFALPANDVKAALESYERGGKIVRPFLGVRYVQITKALKEEMNLARDYGVLLIRGASTADFAVIPGSPADRAGLKEGDIILEVDGKRVDEDHSLTQILKSYKPNDRISIKVYSGDSEKTIPITLGETN
jgi:serine protease Do